MTWAARLTQTMDGSELQSLTLRLSPVDDYLQFVGAYLVARRTHQGDLLARLHPLTYANFVATAGEIGYPSHAAQVQWAALGLVCAPVGLDPPQIRQHHIDLARSALVDAAQARGRGSLRSVLPARRSLRGGTRPRAQGMWCGGKQDPSMAVGLRCPRIK